MMDDIWRNPESVSDGRAYCFSFSAYSVEAIAFKRLTPFLTRSSPTEGDRLPVAYSQFWMTNERDNDAGGDILTSTKANHLETG